MLNTVTAILLTFFHLQCKENIYPFAPSMNLIQASLFVRFHIHIEIRSCYRALRLLEYEGFITKTRRYSRGPFGLSANPPSIVELTPKAFQLFATMGIKIYKEK